MDMKKTLCLNMIVKNEREVIERSLGSIKHKIDSWAIVDTGSTDGTQEAIREFMKDLPGELIERPWVDFEHNRNEALDLAQGKGDYVLFIDADEEWVIEKDFNVSEFESDFYTVKIRDQNVDLHRILIIKNDPHWRWEGVLHEEIRPGRNVTGEMLEGVMNYGQKRDGQRAKDPKCYQKDAEILQKAFDKKPTPRYAFYLAQSYGAARDFVSALKYYEKRAAMGGFRDEVYWSLFCVGCLQEELGYPPETIIRSYNKAFEFEQNRAEALHHLAYFYHKNSNHFMGYIVSRQGLEIPIPYAMMYTLREIYDHLLLYRFACCAHFIGKLDEAKAAYEKLLANPNLPDHCRTVVANNLKILR
ncbi:MAG: glycosyltransferase [Verrucomicrobia bacterium]|nr:glycosyltransferase [Verrucomicrobiota bacterium]